MLRDNPEWMQQGSCLGRDPNIWFPLKAEDVPRAKAICETCPVQEPCRAYGLAMSDDHRGAGIYGGLTHYQRDKIRRSIRRAS